MVQVSPTALHSDTLQTAAAQSDNIMQIAAQSQTLVSKLEALQCHFNWDLDISTSLLNHRRDNLEDIGTNDGNPWLGHIYNLRAFIQYKLGSNKEAQKFFNKATEAFSRIRSADEGPWLVVNYGNLAWLHHHLGDQAESEAYLSKINTLNKKYPSPSQEELHPETYAEKAYALMTVSGDKTLVVDNFQRAIEMQPGIREWNTSHALALMYASKHSRTGLEDDILKKMRIAQEQDPENLYFAVHYLDQRAQRGERIEAEAQKALKNHPDERYLKRCAARCYNWKIFGDKKKIDLAQVYALSHDGQAKADQIYQELLESDLEVADKQMLYNNYAKYLYFEKHNINISIRYHMKAVEIPHQSFFRKNSIKELEKIRDKGRDRMCREIRECLANLKEP
ncbi:hypothetical protein JOQ06_005827 [Pogonophryne albipinna]|uniref:Uncharacterized protein n=1 Tax=Pogonophryne albipinna TaxID=1090488 RepID=A0AAD6BI96_9TELE|nr:hypothetical protein JOQ06_005827 [Pogonophryne albipinna]